MRAANNLLMRSRTKRTTTCYSASTALCAPPAAAARTARRTTIRITAASSPSPSQQLASPLSLHRRTFASSSKGWTERGYDITADSLDWGDRPKVVIEAYAPTGFDVQNTVKKIDEKETSDGSVHMNGSILAFPFGCFLWKIASAEEVTLESLAPILLHRPKVEYLFIGCNKKKNKQDGGVPREEMRRIQTEMLQHGIVAEQLALSDAIGTFNILNAEDRQVAVALVIDPSEERDDDE